MERHPIRTKEGIILGRSFYERGAIEVARDLLGKVLEHEDTSGIIVETEAYLGGDDLASHSAAGLTERTRVIFGPPGHAYVYLSYGVHELLNIVTERDGVDGCVLIRALEPWEGREIMRARRPGLRPDSKNDRRLASGPGNLTRALGITRALNGADVTEGPIVVRDSGAGPVPIQVSPRIGITKCVEWPLRFTIAGNRFVSR